MSLDLENRENPVDRAIREIKSKGKVEYLWVDPNDERSLIRKPIGHPEVAEHLKTHGKTMWRTEYKLPLGTAKVVEFSVVEYKGEYFIVQSVRRMSIDGATELKRLSKQLSEEYASRAESLIQRYFKGEISRDDVLREKDRLSEEFRARIRELEEKSWMPGRDGFVEYANNQYEAMAKYAIYLYKDLKWLEEELEYVSKEYRSKKLFGIVLEPGLMYAEDIATSMRNVKSELVKILEKLDDIKKHTPPGDKHVEKLEKLKEITFLERLSSISQLRREWEEWRSRRAAP